MKINNLLLGGLMVCLFYSSCGVISKARYGNGYKLNLEWGKDEKPEYAQAKKAEKKQIKKNEIKEKETISENLIINNKSEESIEILKVDNDTKEPIRNLNLKDKIKKKKEAIFSKESNSKEDKLPMEKLVKIGAYLFYGGIIVNIIGLLAGVSIPFIGLFILVGFILAIIGLRKIKRSNYQYRGDGLAISIIVIFLLSLLISLIYLLMIIALFL